MFFGFGFGFTPQRFTVKFWKKKQSFGAIPIIGKLSEPLRTQVRIAFADSIRVIWLVMIPFGGVGLIAALGMKAHRLETLTDEQWGIAQKTNVDEETLNDTNVARS